MRVLRLLPLLLLAACVVQGPRGRATTPPGKHAAGLEPSYAFLWEVKRPGAPERPLYLAGSVHLGQPSQLVLPPSLEAAFARATTLVVEVDTDSIDKEALQTLVAALGVLPSGDSLSAHLTPETRQLLPGAINRVGLDAATVERMRPWLLSITLAALELQKAGYAESGGVDHLLIERARGKKAIIGLETAESQLRLLAGFPENLQDLMLRDQLKQSGRVSVEIARMVTAWEGGNPDAMADVVFERADNPVFRPLYERLFHERNRAMAERLTALADAPDIHLVVVGAAHLVGDQGLPALLAKRGFEVRQMRRAL